MKKLFSVLLALCLIAGLLPVVASAAPAGRVKIISDSAANTHTEYAATEGSTTYLVTVNGAATTATANESNYNIKIDYPAGEVPTVYLKNAELSCKSAPLQVLGGQGVAEDYKIVVEADSKLVATGGAGMLVSATGVTITGPGKLTIDTKKGYGIYCYNSKTNDDTKETFHDLVLDDANLDVSIDTTEGGWGVGIGGSAKNIVIDGGSVKVVAVGGVSALYSINGDLLITGGAQVDLDVTDRMCISSFNNFIMESGHLKLRTAGENAPAISGCPNIKVKGGTMDIIGKAVAYGKIDLTEYNGEYTAVVCQSQDGKGAKPYDPDDEKGLGYQNYFQLTIGTSYEVTVKNGTANVGVAAKGDTVTITARIAPEGKAFDKWEINAGNVKLADPTASSTTFTMPGENVKITATYKSVETEDEPAGDGNNGGEEAPEESTPDASTPDASTPDASTPDASTPEESTPVESTPDTNKNEGNKKPAKKGEGSGITVVILVLIVVVSVGIGAVGVILYLKLKANKKPVSQEEAAEETAEDAEVATEENAE